MQPGAESYDLRLFAVSSTGELKHFRTVEFVGGERGDLPSQGAFSFDADRDAIVALEGRMISAFGHAVIHNFAASGARHVDLGGKMLTDEHLPTLETSIRAGAFTGATTLSLNACPLITTLPDLTGMASLERLTLINASALRTLPDLSGLPALEQVKLESCDRLEALPKLPLGVKWDDVSVPEHLRAQAGV